MNATKPSGSVKAAVVQHPPVFLNLEQSMEKAVALVEEAADHGARVVAFPETWLTGYPLWLDAAPAAGFWDHPPAKALYRLLVENALTVPGEHLDRLMGVAGKTGACVVMGAHERSSGTLYNALILIGSDGTRFKVRRKLVPTYTERMVWGRGDGSTLEALDTEYGPLGGMICWEHWMPLARAAMHNRCESIHVAQWPSVHDVHQLASRHYAFEGRCFVLASGCVLKKEEMLEGYRSLKVPGDEGFELLESVPSGDEDLLLTGGTAVIGPDGGYLAGPVFGDATIVYADLELERITELKMSLDVDGHYSRPDVFHLEVDTRAKTNVDWR
jgi:predicted amidohydrolase